MLVRFRKARREKGYTQQQLADLVGVKRPTVSRWEKGIDEPDPYYVPVIREALDSQDPDLFENIEPETQETQSCVNETVSDKLDSSDSHHIGVQESEEETDMNKQRRELITIAAGTIAAGTIAASTGVALVNHTQILTSPLINTDVYLDSVKTNIPTWWDLLNQGHYSQLELKLSKHVPALREVATVISPYQKEGANYLVEAIILQIILAKHRLDYVACETYCAELPLYGRIAGNSTVLAVALDWQGNTYYAIDSTSHNAVPTLHDALSHAGNDALLKSSICSDLSQAYSQDNIQDDYERKAREYSELAHAAFPDVPELSTVYRCIGFSSSELYHFDGIMYLNLARYTHNRDYAQMAHKTFERSLSEKVLSSGNSCALLVRKADASSALGRMDECISCLTEGYSIALRINSLRTLAQISDVLRRVPENRQKETSIQQLQKDVSHALVVARR